MLLWSNWYTSSKGFLFAILCQEQFFQDITTSLYYTTKKNISFYFLLQSILRFLKHYETFY